MSKFLKAVTIKMTDKRIPILTHAIDFKELSADYHCQINEITSNPEYEVSVKWGMCLRGILPEKEILKLTRAHLRELIYGEMRIKLQKLRLSMMDPDSNERDQKVFGLINDIMGIIDN